MAFSPALVERSVRELLDAKVYLGALTPALIYAAVLARSRTAASLRWAILVTLVLVNLAWFVLGSVSWLRYAFPALAVSALLVAKLFQDWTSDFRLRSDEDVEHPGESQGGKALALRWAALGWLAVMIVVPVAQTARQIASPAFNAPAAMAEYLNAHLPTTVEIETWEPEMGFLTDHSYHYPPESLLATAVDFVWRGGPSPSTAYDFMDVKPDYVLVGVFSRWVDVYPPDELVTDYKLETSIGGYDLYARR
jgi:hypothetical protein